MSAVVLTGISKSFGGVRVLRDVSLSVAAGRVTALIGPNGAGKSTLANIVTGYVRPSAGRVEVLDVDVTTMSVERRARLGLGRTFQNLELFHGMSVEQNVVLGRYRTHPPLTRWLHGPGHADFAAVQPILGDLDLRSFQHQDVESLSFGQAKMVEPARVLAMEPQVIVMDEPAAGLTAAQTSELGGWISRTAASGVAVLIIEHNMRLIMEIADHIFVLDNGALIAEGSPREVSTSQVVLDAYLGAEPV